LKQVIYLLENNSRFMDSAGNINEDYEGMTVNEIYNERWLINNIV